jgi:hypothetical protein
MAADALTSHDASVSLEAMMRRASKMARQMFDRDGEIPMFWLFETASREQRMAITPVVGADREAIREAKRDVVANVRELFVEHGVTRYVLVTECWGAASECPDRREMVLIDADDGYTCLSATRDIIRPQHGKPYLGELSEIKPVTDYGGLFRSVFRPSLSSELADDEGTVFVTNVPGTPFQVFGRRGPTGELFVRATCEMSNGKPPPEWVEVVKGPEAERLISLVLRYVEKH